MIHFFLTFSNDATQSPFGLALRDLGLPHRIISRRVLLRYNRRVWLLLVGLPTLFARACSGAWESMAGQAPKPDDIVVNSHLEVLAFALVRALLGCRARIHLLGFIFTQRPQAWLDLLRRTYLKFVFSRAERVICFSALEQKRYSDLFPAARSKFVHIPYGLHIDGYEQQTGAFRDAAHAPALSAGRSGRDYLTLFSAFARSGRDLRVACDSERALAGCAASSNIVVLRHCYDDEYSHELREAGLVVVPLAVTDISAGQMVAIQAMAYHKPIVVTYTPTIEEYLRHEQEALLVPPGDPDALAAAVERLRQDAPLARRLADAAYHAYVQHHSMRAYVRNIVDAIGTARSPGQSQ